MGKSSISMAIFNSYVKLPEGNLGKSAPIPLAFHNGLKLVLAMQQGSGHGRVQAVRYGHMRALGQR
jgi:hypothetical protein